MADAYLHPELRNIAPNLDEKEVAKIGADCYEAFEDDRKSRLQWEEKHGQWVKLYYQTDKPLNPPYAGYGSEESIPILAEACTQFQARAFKAMFPSRNFLRAIPVGKDDAQSVERAKRVSMHMAWQLLVQDRKYKRLKDQLLMGMALHGSVFTKTYHDPLRQRNVVDNVRAVDLVVPYGTGPREIDDIERKTQMIRMSVNATRILAKGKYFSKPAEPYMMASGLTPSPQDRAHDDAHGITQSAYYERGDALLLEQHTLLDLDKDGIAEPYIVVIDAQTKEVMRIAIRYETDELGNPKAGKMPVEYFTHWPYMENPDGFYGLGMGHLLAQANVSANKLLREFIDAGMLANIGNHSGFISSQLGGIAEEMVEIALGTFKKIPGSADDIGKGIYQFKFPGPSESLLKALTLIMQRTDRLATVTESLTGQTEKVMQPTTVMALIEQGLQVFSTVYERVNDSWGMELGKLYRLNYKHMDPKEYFNVLDIDGSWQQMTTGRDDYKPDLQIMPIADPKMVTEQQKISRAQVEWQFLSQNMLVMQSPQHYHNASRRYLENIGTEQVEEVLPNPGGMVRIDDPMMENMAVLAPFPIMPMAFPDQDHQGHIQVHLLAYADKTLGNLARSMLKTHIDAHQKFGAGVGQAGTQGMAQAAGDSMGSRGAEPTLSGGSMEGGGQPQVPGGVPGSAGSGRFPGAVAGNA